MNKRRSEQLAKVAAPVLRPDETVDFLTIAKVGTPSRKKQTSVLLLTTILTLGMLQVYVVARRYYLVLTSQRLLFFAVTRGTSAPGVLQRQIPRAELTATRPRSRLGITFYVSVKGSPDRLRLAFGQQQRNDANALAVSIGIIED